MKIQSADQQVHLRYSVDTYLQTLVFLENILGKQPFCISSLLLQIQYNKINDVCQPFFYNLDTIFYGGDSGIRTLGGLSPSSVFKTDAFDHSAKSPLMAGNPGLEPGTYGTKNRCSTN